MSTVRMSSLKSKRSDGAINIASGDTLYYPGKIAQVVQIRSDAHVTYSSATTGNGTTIDFVYNVANSAWADMNFRATSTIFFHCSATYFVA